MVIKKN